MHPQQQAQQPRLQAPCAAQACAYTAEGGAPLCAPPAASASAPAPLLVRRAEAAKDAASFRLSERKPGAGAFYADADAYELDCAVKVRPVDPASLPW